MNTRWIELEKNLGFINTRILAHAISWAFRSDNWRFLSWYTKLKPELKGLVDKYFDELLLIELKEMSETKKSDISHLIRYFNLPEDQVIYKAFSKEEKRAFAKRMAKKRRWNYITKKYK